MKAIGIAAILLGLLGAPVVHGAPIITFTGDASSIAALYANSDAANAALRAAAIAAGETPRTITFEDQAVGAFTSMSVATGVTATIGGIINTSPSFVSGIQNQNPNSNNAFNTTRPNGAKYIFLDSGAGSATLTFLFSTPVNFFGLYFTGLDSAGSVTASFNDGVAQSFVLNTSAQTGSFVNYLGIADPGARFSSVTLTLSTPQYGFGVDDLTIAQVPEPAMTLLLSAGLLGLGLARRRRRNACD